MGVTVYVGVCVGVIDGETVGVGVSVIDGVGVAEGIIACFFPACQYVLLFVTIYGSYL